MSYNLAAHVLQHAMEAGCPAEGQQELILKWEPGAVCYSWLTILRPSALTCCDKADQNGVLMRPPL